MAGDLRKTGLDAVGEVPWGTHFCSFYETEQDLLDTLVPYFSAGLVGGEFCLWIISSPLSVDAATAALRDSLPDLDRYLTQGGMEIISHQAWYLQGGTFDLHRVKERWKEKLQQVTARGYEGMRVSGDARWLQKQDWRDFCDYEKDFNAFIATQRMIVACSYPLSTSGGAEILDVVCTHRIAVALRHGSCAMVEPPELRQAKAELKKLNAELDQRVRERTQELSETNSALRREIARREEVEASLRQAQMHLESVLSSVVDVHFLLDRHWRYLYLNKAAALAMGHPSEEIVGRTLWEMYPDIVGTELERQFRLAMGGVTVAFEYYYPTTDTWWENRFYPSPEGLSVFATDITVRKKAEAEISAYQERLRSMASEMSFVEERERHKIATALHDQVGQTLALAGIKLAGLRQGVETLGGQVEEIRDLITEAIRHSRTLTFELSSPILYELGLEAAICSLADDYQKDCEIRIDCRDDRQPKPLCDDLRLVLYQGVRELLVNAVKHAQPGKISISCRRQGTEIRILVEDDGAGFDTADSAVTGKSHGFGLFSLRERLRYLGGSMDIDSMPGSGTRVELTAPLAVRTEKEK